MRVLITGGSGFVGKRVAKRLAARGDNVVIFDLAVADALAKTAGITVFGGDVTAMADVAKAFSGAPIDAVVHCAAVVGVAASIKSPRKVMEVNVQGSLNVLEAMRTYGVGRMVHISSIEVYGDFCSPIVDESHALRPHMAYGISKAAVEQLGRTYRDLYGLECINLRGSWIYAPDYPRQRLPNFLVDQVCRGEAVQIASGGDSVMDYVHAEDFVDCVVAALDCPAHGHDAYNVGSGTGVSLFQLADLVKQLVPSADITVGPGRYELQPGIPMRIQGALDIARAREALHYAPRRGIRRGLEELIRGGLKRT